MPGDGSPLRILHVVGGMNRGGAETWLMHMLRGMDRARFRMDFLVHTPQPCAYDEEIRSLGSRVTYCEHPHQPLIYAQNFRRIIDQQGPYDIVHSAVHHFSGYVLRLAQQCGIPGRIAHSHNTSAGMDRSQGMARRVYFALMERWIQTYATAGLACSSPAAAALFGEEWASDPRWYVHYPSTDLRLFEQAVERAEVRAEFGIPESAFVIGHVGRFDHQKNHRFLLDIAERALACGEDVYFLLVGDGPLRSEIETRAASAAFPKRIVFAGVRSDVPRLMLGAMDVFTLPSLHEGLPLVMVEAQAAGLPVVASAAITREAGVVQPLVRWLSLQETVEEWSRELLAWRRRSKLDRSIAFQVIDKSPFNSENAKSDLARIYRSCWGAQTAAASARHSRRLERV